MNKRVKQISQTNQYTYFLMNDGTVKVVGGVNSQFSQITINGNHQIKKAVTIPELDSVKQIATCDTMVYFLMEDNTVKTCGVGVYGQLGLGSVERVMTPTLIPNLINVKQISAGSFAGYFLLNDGTVKACGENDRGNLGDGTTEDKNVPIIIPNLTNVKEITAADSAVHFLLNNGTVKTCGCSGTGGGIGTGVNNMKNTLTPTLISGLSDVKKVVANYATYYFILNDGTIKACGYNDVGQICSLPINTYVPTLVPELTDIKDISVGIQYTCYLLNNNTVKVSGTNALGQTGLGVANNDAIKIPIQIPNLENVEQVCAGNNSTYFILTDGNVKACGFNGYGQLSLGDMANRTVPTLITDLYSEPTSKYYLYIKDQACYTDQGEKLMKASDNWNDLSESEKKGLFLESADQLADISEMEQLGKFKIMTFEGTNESDKSSYTVKAVPNAYVVLPKKLMSIESYDGINKAILTSAFAGQGNCKVLVTNDLTQYKTYKEGKWQNINHTDFNEVKADGIQSSDLANISRSDWDEFLKGKSGFGLAYLMMIEATADQCEIDKLALTVDMKGTIS